MGLFDFLTKEVEPNQQKQSRREKSTPGFSARLKSNQAQNPQPDDDGNVAVRVFKPTSFDDVCAVIDFLLLGKPAIVNVEAVKEQTIQRVMDILSGACYALHGTMSEISHNIYLISPSTQMI
ncbi:MAG: cell division protein SepF [Clostridia bacterium]|nr:cell division protein SepF [Clostridia bacterium]MBQ4587073.1 cell division protein SepF [Clostridia bacterium]MBQ6883214.1 cell division protein SepF [Clostridia bacterium]MBR2933485.1 cell division protein SepF [Clostridia bacterium]MBR6688174.1 cell division protein SepF [Clostridia bacterium]